ncbi:MAG: hypothetical protein ABSG13_11455 [Bryobacteraceae bacterium]
MTRRSLLAFALFASAALSQAQWPRVAPKNLPRTADGKVNLNAPTPRTREGTPDLSGVWEMYSESDPAPPKLLLNLAADLKPGEVQMLPSAEALYQERQATHGKDHPGAQCLPSGMPEKDTVPAPYKIVQTPDLIVFLYESRTIYRQIFTDGRPLPLDPNPTWQGYSVGHWDGDTLVVETAGFNGKTWLDMAGHPATESMHLTERFTRRDLGHMDVQFTIDDPKAYAKPWTVSTKIHLVPDDELIEHICEENNKAPGHMVGR